MEELEPKVYTGGRSGFDRCKICNTQYSRQTKHYHRDLCKACGYEVYKERKWADWDKHPEKIYSRDVFELIAYFESRFPKLSAELLGDFHVDNDPLAGYVMDYRGEHDEE